MGPLNFSLMLVEQHIEFNIKPAGAGVLSSTLSVGGKTNFTWIKCFRCNQSFQVNFNVDGQLKSGLKVVGNTNLSGSLSVGGAMMIQH